MGKSSSLEMNGDSFNSLVIIKMESLFHTTLDDDFLSYTFYTRGINTGIKYLFFYFTQYEKFQMIMSQELERAPLLNNLCFNNDVIKEINKLSCSGHRICLMSHYSSNLVYLIKCYLNFHEFVGNTKGSKKCFKTILRDFLNEKKEIEKYTLVSDELLLNFTKNTILLVQTGSLYKILINFLRCKDIIMIPISNSINRPLISIVRFIQRKNFNRIICIPILLLVPVFELFNFLYVFFPLVFILMIFSLFIQHFFDYYHEVHTSVLYMILETNNLINIYKIVVASFPISPNENRLRTKYVKHGVLKNYGSFRIGILIFLLANLTYMSSWQFSIIQVLILILFLKLPFRKFNIYTSTSFFIGLVKLLTVHFHLNIYKLFI